MTVTGEAYHTMDPRVRDFFRNYAQRHLVHSWKVEYIPDQRFYLPFLGEEFIFYPTVARHLARGQICQQIRLYGYFNTGIVYFDYHPMLPVPPQQPLHAYPTPAYTSGDVPDIWHYVPTMADNYPRLKYNVRRHYWTGKPRRRMNL